MTVRPYIRPRRLDKRVRVETKTTTKGNSGGQVTSWTLSATVWAGISNTGGKEMRSTDSGGGVVAESDSQIEIRYRAGITAERTRIVFGSTVYNIVHVDNVFGQNDRMILTCKSGVNNG